MPISLRDPIVIAGALVFALVGGIAIYQYSSNSDVSASEDQSQTAPTPAVQPDQVETQRPPDESRIMMLDQATAEYRAAPNDIVQRQAQDRWDKKFCDAIRSTNDFSHWTGRVTSITEGGGFEVEVADGVRLDGHFDPGTPLFNAIAQLQTQQPISISGRFTHQDACDVFINRTFTVEFSEIHAL